MPTSWAQHKTVVEQQSRLEVEQIFSKAGDARDLEGNAPLLCADTKRVWFVLSGAVDLFLVDVEAGAPKGRRRHVARIEEGELFLEMPVLGSRDDDRQVGVLAVGVSGTRVGALAQDKLRALARGLGALDAVHGLLDIWVRRLAEAIAPPGGRPDAEPLGNGRHEVGPEPKIVTTTQKTMWFHQISGTLDYCGRVELAPLDVVRLLPLTRASWARVHPQGELRVLDAATFFRSDTEWLSFDYFHRVAVACLVRAREQERTEERHRVGARAALDRRLVEGALVTLARGDAEPALERAGEGAQMEAVFRALGAHLGISVRVPPPDVEASLEAFSRSCHLRTRRVVLKPGWWREAGEPMVASLDEDARPVALVPRRAGGYALHDPDAPEPTRVFGAIAERVHPVAHSVYRPFPARALAPVDLLKWSLAGTGYEMSLLLGAGLFIGLLGLAVPYAFGVMIDTFIPDAEAGLLLQMGLALVVVSLATLFAQLSRGLATVRAETRMASAIQAAVWDRLLALPVPFFRRFSAGDLALRANGIDRIRRALSGGALAGALSSLFSLASFGLLVYYDAGLALWALFVALVGVAIALGVGLASLRLARDHEHIDGQLAAQVLEYLTGISKLRIAGAERRAFARWAARFSDKRALILRLERLQNAYATVEALYPVLGTMLIFFLVTRRAMDLSTGQFVAFYAAYGTFVGSLTGLVSIALEQLEILPQWERARPILEAAPEVDEVKAFPGRLRGAIQVSRVHFRYEASSPPVLDGVDFEVKPGEMVAIVGGSGAGKSTLLRVLLGFETPSSGSVFYDGQDLETLDATEVRRQLGVVLQNGELMAGDLLSNIVGSRNVGLDEAWAAARAAGLAEEIEAMPMQMHTVVAQGGKSLSGGQQQRVQIARALVGKPRILLFDEATSALDERTQKVVSDTLDQLDATRIVIAHRLSTIRHADRIIVLERGRVAQAGTFEDLMSTPGPFRDLAERQIV